MGAFDIFIDLWNWAAYEILGSEIVAAIVVAVVTFMVLSAIGLPRPIALGFMIPLALGLIFSGFLGWFGWVIIMVAGVVFGFLIYKLYE